MLNSIPGDELGAEFVSFQQLLQESDFVIVACPLNSETKHLFNAEAFALMKKSSILVNIARGGKLRKKNKRTFVLIICIKKYYRRNWARFACARSSRKQNLGSSTRCHEPWTSAIRSSTYKIEELWLVCFSTNVKLLILKINF